MGYFAPPSHENWRMVSARSHERGIRIDWLAPDALATTWRVLATSVVWSRSRTDPPDLSEAMEAGLLPPWTDGDWTIDSRLTVSGNAFFVCRGTDSHAYPDFTAVLRMRIDDDLLVGMACRVRPPCSREDAKALLEWMGTDIEEWFEEPVPAVDDPTRSAEGHDRVGPLLQRLDEAEAAGDQERAATIVDALRPDLARAPLSRFALGIHLTEGWIEKRRAFSGDSRAASRAIDVLRRAIDTIDSRMDADLICAAAQWLAEAYSVRDQPGDLGRAVLAYQTLLRLDPASQPRRALIHLRIGILHRSIAERLKASPEQARELRERAMEQFDEAERIYREAADVAGRVEIGVARADLVRLVPLSGDDDLASTLYATAWNLILGAEGAPRFAGDRFEELARHICRCMTAADHRRFGPLPDDESSLLRGLAVFLRPLGITRVLALRPPGEVTEKAEVLTLEIALARALQPSVAFTYIGGPMHPGAASMITTGSPSADWRIPVKMLVHDRDLILIVPGETPGMQWELRFLVEEHLLGRTMIVMLPADVDPQAAERWAGARAEASGFGLKLPAYRDRGGFFRLSGDGVVVKDLPFTTLWERAALLDAVADLLSTPASLRERLGPDQAGAAAPSPPAEA
jgi:hypothetical protein